MNPKANKFTVKYCEVCNYPFSDAHHLYPKNRGGAKTIVLCPNHHRFANMIQVMVERCLHYGNEFDPIMTFAKEHFDEAFVNIVWKLINSHCQEEVKVADEIY